jgi:hypothetical protein
MDEGMAAPQSVDMSLVKPAQLACAMIGTFFFYWLGLTIFAGAVISAFSG